MDEHDRYRLLGTALNVSEQRDERRDLVKRAAALHPDPCEWRRDEQVDALTVDEPDDLVALRRVAKLNPCHGGPMHRREAGSADHRARTVHCRKCERRCDCRRPRCRFPRSGPTGDNDLVRARKRNTKAQPPEGKGSHPLPSAQTGRLARLSSPTIRQLDWDLTELARG